MNHRVKNKRMHDTGVNSVTRIKIVDVINERQLQKRLVLPVLKYFWTVLKSRSII